MKHRRLAIRAVTLATVLLASCALAISADEDSSSANTLTAVLDSMTKAAYSVKSAQGDFKVHTWTKNKYGAVLENEVKYKLATVNPLGAKARYLCESTTTLIKNEPGSPEGNPEKLKPIPAGTIMLDISQFDGQSLLSYDPKMKQAIREPQEKPDPSLAHSLRYIMDLTDTLVSPSYSRNSTEENIEIKTRILRNETIDGSDCIVLESEQKITPSGKDPWEIASIVWVAKNKGYAVLKKQVYAVSSGSRRLLSETSFDLKNFGDGVWVPSKSIFTHFDTNKDGKNELTHKQVVTLDPCFRINQKIDDDDLRIHLPKGTRVHDRMKNSTYTVK